MPKKPRLVVKDSSDEDDLLTYWRLKKKHKNLPELKGNEVFQGVAKPMAVETIQPFVYKRSKSVQLSGNDSLQLLTQSPLISLYWEGMEDMNLLESLHETCEDMKMITNSEGYILYVVDDTKGELFYCSKSLKELTGKRYTWTLGVDKSIATYVAKARKAVMKNDDSIDARFPDGQDLGSFDASNILVVPIGDGTMVVAVVELYRINNQPYTENDLQTVKYLMSLAGNVLAKNREVVVKKKCNEVNDFLLHNLRKFSDSTLENDDYFVGDLVNSAAYMLNCESVTYFSLSEDQKMRRIYTNQKNPVLNLNMTKKKLRIMKERELANVIKNSKGIANFIDVFNDPRFNKEVDRQIGLLIRSVLGHIICKEKSKCSGVIMAINKQSEDKFTAADEKVFGTITKYLRTGLVFMEMFAQFDRQRRQHSMLLDIIDRQITYRNRVAEMYHAQETIYMPPDFYQFDYVANDPDVIEIPKYIFHMINSVASTYVPDKDQLYKLIFGAKKLHRDNPFHNFHHAFNCVHTVFMIFRVHPEVFSPLEKYAMLVAALLQDCDHPGLTTTYLEFINHPIADQSETTPIEAHQYRLGKLLLKKTNIFTHLKNNELEIFQNIFKDSIISSNIGVFMKRRVKLKPLIESKTFNWKNDEHRGMIRSLIAMAASFSTLAKSEEDVLKSTRRLYTEFFMEDDLVKEKKLSVATVPSRKDKFDIPNSEVKFCSYIALPCFEMLMELLPATAPLYHRTLKTQEMWQRMAAEIKKADETDEISEKIVSYLMTIG